jgi:plastocyanin
MRRLLVAIALAGTLVVGLTACGSSSKGAAAPPAAPTDLRGQTAVDIDATGNQFSPADIVIDAGTKVTWHNKDAVTHNIKKSADAVDFGGNFGTDSFGPTKTYSFTFTKPGTFTYTCTIHTLMNGTITVDAKA